MNIKTFQPDFTEKGKRIDAYLSEQIPELTRSAIQLLIQNSQIKINDSVPKKNYRILGTETITVEQNDPHEVEIIPENIPIDIIYVNEKNEIQELKKLEPWKIYIPKNGYIKYIIELPENSMKKYELEKGVKVVVEYEK